MTTMKNIPFNIPYRSENEMAYVNEAIHHGHLSGNGPFTQKCQAWFEEQYDFGKCFLTHSCTGALEMASLLLDIQPGDEILIPSYTFVTSASTFELRGAKLVFCDSKKDHPNIDVDSIRANITEQTKALVIVHYGGVACDMDEIMALVEEHDIYLIEDAAHAIDAYYDGRSLGSFGHLAAFSFHHTKNITSGEGGMLVVNDVTLTEKAEIIWEKGTNRAAFFRGEIGRYEWISLGSSFSPSELVAAYLWAQLEESDIIVSSRLNVWEKYAKGLKELKDSGHIHFLEPDVSKEHNAHIFHIICSNGTERNGLIQHLKNAGVRSSSHYLCLHQSPYFKEKYQGGVLDNAIGFEKCLLRLPVYPTLDDDDQYYIISSILEYYSDR